MRLALGCFLILAACSEGTQLTPVQVEIDEYVRTLPYLPIEEPAVTSGAATEAVRDGDYSCTTENLKETRQYDRIVAYAANSDSLWPGAIISADSVVSGLFTQVV